MLILFAAPALWPAYAKILPQALAEVGLSAQIVTEAADPALVDYIIYAPSAPLQDFTPFTRCKAVLSLWAGVERIVGNTTLTQPLARMVDPYLTEGMVEWVVGHCLRQRHVQHRARLNEEPTQVSPATVQTERAAIQALWQAVFA